MLGKIRPAPSLLGLLLLACSRSPTADLVIHDATVFDARAATLLPHHTVVVGRGRIRAVTPVSKTPTLRAALWIEAEGRLLIPGLIDVHHHTGSVLGDSITPGGGEITNLSMEPDSITAYRRRWAAEYLPYGVTTVREAGGNDRYTDLMTAWMKPVPWAPDFEPSGGALVSPERGRVPYEGHTEVADPEEAIVQVNTYKELGFKYIKLYWRLREPEFRAATRRALELGLLPYAHIDFGVFSIEAALDLGVREFEHAYTLAQEVLTREEVIWIWNHRTQPYLRGRMDGAFFVDTMEKLQFLGEKHPEMMSLIDRLARLEASVTPTLHVFAHPYGLAYFQSPPRGGFEDTSWFSTEMLERGRAAYRILASYVLAMYERGVRLNLGTDCSQPGRSALSEMFLLNEAGIPMNEVLRIATYNGARALRLEGTIGSIETGKKAHLVLFERSPLADPRNLFSAKTVIKDGVLYTPSE